MRTLGVFSPTGSRLYGRGTRVIVRTDRGLETGQVLCEALPRATEGLANPPSGQILRAMTAEDGIESTRMREQQVQEYQTCQRCIAQLGLDMQLVDVEHIFGGERILVYYLAEGRVDFRELVRLLAGEFQTRIEMRQIGVRDEAKLLADYGDCGKAVCCNTNLTQMPPVSMKMAKVQKATLDPAKISGRCGRLKCCLRYEYDVYEKMQKQLPPIGSRVDTPEGRARVVGHEILSGQVLVETDDRRSKLVDAESVAPATGDAPDPAQAPRRDNSTARQGRKPRGDRPPDDPDPQEDADR
jgi:cell fate regulator YaaT (PSP1 superfamily)